MIYVVTYRGENIFASKSEVERDYFFERTNYDLYMKKDSIDTNADIQQLIELKRQFPRL